MRGRSKHARAKTITALIRAHLQVGSLGLRHLRRLLGLAALALQHSVQLLQGEYGE